MEESVNTEYAAGSEVAEELMTRYTEFSIGAQLPHIVDGLTKVQRRILSVVGNEKDNIIHKIEGWCGPIGERHPHGGGSISETMSRMMQVFRHHHPFFRAHGQAGTYIVPAPAAPRYLRASLDPFSRDMFLDTHPAAIQWVPRESGPGIEEAYLIPKIPMGLVLSTTGIATAFSTDTYPRLLADICKLTIWYCKQVKVGKHTAVWSNVFPESVLHYLIPNYPIRQIILNKKELLKEYAKGNFTHPVALEGGLIIKGDCIIVTSFPHNTDYGKQVNRLRQARLSKIPGVAVINSVHDGKSKYEPNREGWLTIKFRRGVNPYDYLETVKKILGVRTTHKANPQYLNKTGKNKLTGPGEILSVWYEERYNAVYTQIQKRIESLYRDLRELEARIIIKDNLDRVIEICKMDADVRDRLLASEFQLSKFQVEVVTRINLKTINDASRDQFVADLEKVNQQIPLQKAQLENIVDVMISDVKKIMTNYANDYKSPTIIPEYIGVVRKGVDTRFLYKDEVPSSGSRATIIPEVFKHIYVTDPLGRWVSNDLIEPSRYGQYQHLQYSPVPCKYTVMVQKGSDRKYRICYYDKLLVTDGGTLVGDEYTYITRKGDCLIGKTTELPLRKAKDSAGNLTDVVHVSPVTNMKRLVFYTNTKEVGVVRLSIIDHDQQKARVVVGGSGKFYVVPYTEEPLVLELPETIMKGFGGSVSVKLSKKVIDYTKDHQIIKITKSMTI